MSDGSDDDFQDLQHESKALQKYLQLRKSNKLTTLSPKRKPTESFDIEASSISGDSLGLGDFFPQSAANTYRHESDDEGRSSPDIKSLRQLFRNSLSEKVDVSIKTEALNAEIVSLKAMISTLSSSCEHQKRMAEGLQRQKLPALMLAIFGSRSILKQGKYFRKWTRYLLCKSVMSHDRLTFKIARKNILKSRQHAQTLAFFRWIKHTRLVALGMLEKQQDSLLEACVYERWHKKLTSLRFKPWRHYTQKMSQRRTQLRKLIRLKKKVTQRRAFWVWHQCIHGCIRLQMRLRYAAQMTASSRLAIVMKHQTKLLTTRHAWLKMVMLCNIARRNEIILRRCRLFLPCYKPFNKWRARTVLAKPTIPIGLEKLVSYFDRRGLSRVHRYWAKWAGAVIRLTHVQSRRQVAAFGVVGRAVTRWRTYTEQMRLRGRLHLPFLLASVVNGASKLSVARRFFQWHFTAGVDSTAARLQAEMLNVSAELCTSESVFTETRKQLAAERGRVLLLTSQVTETKAAYATKFRRKNEYVLSVLARLRKKKCTVLRLALGVWRSRAVAISAVNKRIMHLLRLRLQMHCQWIQRCALQKWCLKHSALGTKQAGLRTLLRRVRRFRLLLAFGVFAQFIHNQRKQESRLLTASEKVSCVVAAMDAAVVSMTMTAAVAP